MEREEGTGENKRLQVRGRGNPDLRYLTPRQELILRLLADGGRVWAYKKGALTYIHAPNPDGSFESVCVERPFFQLLLEEGWIAPRPADYGLEWELTEVGRAAQEGAPDA